MFNCTLLLKTCDALLYFNRFEDKIIKKSFKKLITICCASLPRIFKILIFFNIFSRNLRGEEMSEYKAPILPLSQIQTHNVVEGSTILLPCNFSTSEKFFKASWSRGKEKLTDNFNVISNDSRLNIILQYDLKIENVQREDHNNYVCLMGPFESLTVVYKKIAYTLKIIDSLENIVTNYSEIVQNSRYDKVIAGIVNETVILPCQGIYLKLEKATASWRTESVLKSETISTLTPDARWPKLETKKTIVGGFILEIQNVKFSDSVADFVCHIQDPETNESYGIFTHKLIVLNRTSDACSPSPCGLNAECRPLANYTECACRPNFKGNPPICRRVKQEKWRAYPACLTENCKKRCETFCGSNAKCVVKEYRYECVCFDNYNGYPSLNCSKLDPPYNLLPRHGSESKTYVVYLNETVTLQCRTTISNLSNPLPQTRSYWKKKPENASFEFVLDLPQPRMQIYNQFNLIFLGPQYIHSGYYICKIKGKTDNISYYLNITMNGYGTSNNDLKITKPLDRSFVTYVTTKLGYEVVLPCEGMNIDSEDMSWEGVDSLSSYSKINLELEKARKNEPYHMIKMPAGYDLEIQNVQADDAGIYSCFMPLPGDSGQHFMVTHYVVKILGPRDDQDNPCKGHQCGENSECYVRNENPVCSCTTDKDDCQIITCMNEYCQKMCNETCYSQMNATCKIQNYRWTCACDDGFIRNPENICVPDDSGNCGNECILFSIFGPILFLLLIAAAMFLMKRNRKRLKRRGQHLTKDEILALPTFNRSEVDHYKIYDKQLEFPRHRLFLEDVIGEGYYGRVLKAQANGLPGREGTSTVAVKTLKKNATGYHLADLISEYQILKEFDHPNVIRLLGICSKDGPLYLIMEYAENGSLSSYLRKIKKKKTAKQTDKRDVSDFTSISPKEILNFAWQIAKGMSYLSQMKFVHRDLAARNVLVTKDLICKISDFGLSKDVYSDGIYTKSSKAEVPVKWMAIESLSQDIYTTKSDVWSFGIVLWELITHGDVPYPGLHNRDVLTYLKEGNRLKKPDDCSDEFYEIMFSCWRENPADRPEFQDLVEEFDNMLSSGIYYLQCNWDDKDSKYVIAK